MDPSVGDMYFFLGGQALEIGEFSPSTDAVLDGVGRHHSIVNIGDWTVDGREDVGCMVGPQREPRAWWSLHASWTGTVRLRISQRGH